MSPVTSSSTAVTSSTPSTSNQPPLASVNLTMPSTPCSSQPTIAMAVTSASNYTPTPQAGVTPARCTTTPSLATPISFPAVTSTHERCDLFDEMDTPPLPQYPDCSACRVNFDFPCFATPCMECGLWFHNGCVSEHNCGSETDDDLDSYADLD